MQKTFVWKSEESVSPFGESRIHVWKASFSLLEQYLGLLEAVLAPDEKERVRQFIFRSDGLKFMCARGVLRILLALYLGTSPQAIQFSYNDYGKPQLTSNLIDSSFDFNISHSGDFVLLGFSKCGAIGIDVEKMRDDVPIAQLSTKLFSQREQAVFAKLPTSVQRQAFYNCWVLKEAYIKGVGLGMRLGLSSFDVLFTPNLASRSLGIRHDTLPRMLWYFTYLTFDSNYAAALAAQTPVQQIGQFTVTDSFFNMDV